MFITQSKSKNSVIYYLCEAFRDTRTGKNTSRVVERIASHEELIEMLGPKADIKSWLREYAKQKTIENKRNDKDIRVSFCKSERNPLGEVLLFNGGYLFLKKICYELKLDIICKNIEKKEHLNFNLFIILSNIIYSKLMTDDSATSAYDFSKLCIEDYDFSNKETFKALKILFKYSSYIQECLFKNLNSLMDVEKSIIYYDCSNYSALNNVIRMKMDSKNVKDDIILLRIFYDFNLIPRYYELIQEESIKKQSNCIQSKIFENFKDTNLCISPESNKTSLDDEVFSMFKKCYKINFQDISTLSENTQKWIFDPKGWHIDGSNRNINLEKLLLHLNLDEINIEDYYKYFNNTYYKIKEDAWTNVINKDYKNETLLISFNIEFREWMQQLRYSQMARAKQSYETQVNYFDTKLYKNFIDKYKNMLITDDIYKQNQKGNNINYYFYGKDFTKNYKYDGFYGMSSSLEKKFLIKAIKLITSKKSQADYVFTTIKNECMAWKYLNREECIQSHFITSYIALLVFKFFEYRLGNKHWNVALFETLNSMNFYRIKEKGWIPTYTRTNITDDLHRVFGFETDKNFISNSNMKKILKASKNPSLFNE